MLIVPVLLIIHPLGEFSVPGAQLAAVVPCLHVHFCFCSILLVPYGHVQIPANKTLHKFHVCSPTLIDSNQLMLILFGVPPASS